MSWEPVYRVVKRVPRGRVTTYGAVAKALGMPNGGRTVGWAMASTPRGRGIPWHRVISAGGKIRLPEPHASLQRRLLASEGVELSGASIDMDVFGWEPKRPASRKKKPKSKKRK